MNKTITQSLHASSRAALSSTLLAALLFLAGCGGGSSTTPVPAPTPTPGTTAAQVRIGDAAVDRIVAFEFTIGTPITFTQSNGNSISIAVGSNRFEMSHMAAKFEPLGMLNVPTGTYTSATLNIQNPELIFLDNTGTPVQVGGANQTVTVTFSPGITLGTAPGMVNLDVNVANCIITNAGGTINGINFTGLSFNFTTRAIAPENQQEDETGEVEGLMGKVTSITGSTFVLNTGGSNSELTFTTDNTTQFKDGLTNLAGALNQIVKVQGVTKTDGTLFAREMEGLEGQTGSELDGMIMTVTGNPASSLTLLMQDGMGNGMDMAKIGVTFTADVSGLAASKYTINQGKTDFSGLTVPGPLFPFDPTTIHAGQRAEVENASGMPPMHETFIADKVKLDHQAIGGTVSNFSAGSGGAATFDLTLPPDSHLAILSGQTLVHVYQQPGTNNTFGPIANTNKVRVRGLLFWTGTTFNMIARRITAP
jgi:Domain of unknown function (DUF5666)